MDSTYPSNPNPIPPITNTAAAPALASEAELQLDRLVAIGDECFHHSDIQCAYNNYWVRDVSMCLLSPQSQEVIISIILLSSLSLSTKIDLNLYSHGVTCFT